MRFRTVLGVLAGAVLAVPDLGAQAATAQTPPPILRRTVFELDPATMGAWRAALRQQVAAVRAANLPANEVGWWAMNDLNRTILVWPASRDEMFPANLMGRIAAADSAAAAALRDARSGTRVLSSTTEIFQMMPDLSYQPAEGMPRVDMTGVVTMEYWVAPGQRRAFSEAIRAMNKVMADVKYPYARNMAWFRMGENRMSMTTFIDSRENYYGKNSFNRLAAGNTAAMEAMSVARQALLKTITKMQQSQANFVEGMSYPPGM